MKNYLSFGAGVNSVALMLLLTEKGINFETVYVWMPDRPETHDYILMLDYLGYKIKIITPAVTGKGRVYGNLYDYALSMRMYPGRKPQWCTTKFKVNTFRQYVEKPCIVYIGMAADESHRARKSAWKNIEVRYPLIEWQISRNECIDIIKRHGLPMPPKSGCFFCPYQNKSDLSRLRRKHPYLYHKMLILENENIQRKIESNQMPVWPFKKPLCKLLRDDKFLFSEMDYPPLPRGMT